MHNIEIEGVTLTAGGAHVNGGGKISWGDFQRILKTLPEAAARELGWFPFMAPPSACGQAQEEALKIVQALFPEGEPLDF